MGKINFTTLVDHEHPHLDEIAAMWELKRFGNLHFPGVEKAAIVFSGAGGRDFTGKSAEKLEQEGVLLIGIGGGRFDEHPRGIGDNRRPNECAATLVAHHLGLRIVPWFKDILDAVRFSDLEGRDHPLDLAAIIKAMHRQNPHDPHDVIERTFRILDRLHALRSEARPPVPMTELHRDWAMRRQHEIEEKASRAYARLASLAAGSVDKVSVLHLSAIAAYCDGEERELIYSLFDDLFSDMRDFEKAELAIEKTARWQDLVGRQGHLKVLFAETDSQYAEKIARKLGADVSVIFRTSGHCQIFSRKSFGADKRTVTRSVDMRDLVRLLRLEERYVSGYQPHGQACLRRQADSDWHHLETIEGRVPGAEPWWYFPKGNMIMNGSVSHPNAPVTKIGRERICRLVTLAFGSEFHPQYSKDYCELGQCVGARCPMYEAGLLRCRAIRHERSEERRQRSGTNPT